jgi:hypothetical protein
VAVAGVWEVKRMTRAARGLSSPQRTSVPPVACCGSNVFDHADLAADRNVRAPLGMGCPQGGREEFDPALVAADFMKVL